MGLEKGVGQGFPGACLGSRLRAGEAQKEDQDWLPGSGEGLLGERGGCSENETSSKADPAPAPAPAAAPAQCLGQPILASVSSDLLVQSLGPLSCHLVRFPVPFLT